MNDPDRLSRLLNNLKRPLILPSDVEIVWANYPDPGNVINEHLAILGVPQLKGHLIWIPPKQFISVEYLGEGGFAKVYKGVTEMDTLAMKELKKSMIPELVLNVLLRSPSDAVAHIYGLTKHPQTNMYLMVMFYANDSSLEAQGVNIYDWDIIAEFTLQLLDCLRHIHSKGFMHNDIHPGNVVLYDGSPFLIDIGLSTSAEDMYSSGGFYGRLEYLSPEIFDAGGRKNCTSASDIYSLATVLWRMVTGVPPRRNAIWAIRNNPDGLREELIPGAPEWFTKLLKACWNPRPEMRPNVDELYQILYSHISPSQLWRLHFAWFVSPVNLLFLMYIMIIISFLGLALWCMYTPQLFLLFLSLFVVSLCLLVFLVLLFTPISCDLTSPSWLKLRLKARRLRNLLHRWPNRHSDHNNAKTTKGQFTPDTLWFICNRQAAYQQEAAFGSVAISSLASDDKFSISTLSSRSKYYSSADLCQINETFDSDDDSITALIN